MQSQGGSGTGAFLFVAIMLFLYFLPAAVAFMRRHPSDAAIFALNLLLGWTFLGWVAAFVWSLSAVPARARPAPRRVEAVAPEPAVAVLRAPEPAGAVLRAARIRNYPSWIAGLAHRDPATGRSRADYARREVEPDDELDAVREPFNAHDPKAVRLDHRGFSLGYVPRRHDWIADALDEGRRIRFFVTEVDCADIDRPNVRLDVAVVDDQG